MSQFTFTNSEHNYNDLQDPLVLGPRESGQFTLKMGNEEESRNNDAYKFHGVLQPRTNNSTLYEVKPSPQQSPEVTRNGIVFGAKQINIDHIFDNQNSIEMQMTSGERKSNESYPSVGDIQKHPELYERKPRFNAVAMDQTFNPTWQTGSNQPVKIIANDLNVIGKTYSNRRKTGKSSKMATGSNGETVTMGLNNSSFLSPNT